MPAVPTSVLAVLCADLHLSHKPPLARSNELDWFAAMLRPLNEIKQLAKIHKCPVICAGDVFDHWNAPAKLINWAYKQLPTMYAIPGQHDLPLHRYEDIKFSAYWTLVQANRIYDLDPNKPTKVHVRSKGDLDFYIHAFPWSFEPAPLEDHYIGKTNIAVIHKYIWVGDRKYQNAPLADNLGQYDKIFRDYNAVVVGDNHKGFLTNLMGSEGNDLGIPILNCGGLMRRKADEEDYCPRVGLLMDDFNIVPYDLDITSDVLLPTLQERAEEFTTEGMKEFAKDLNALGGDPLDFRNALKLYIEHNKTNTATAEKIMEAIEIGG